MSLNGLSRKMDALALLDAAAEHPTLDELMRRDPATLTEVERERQVELLRLDRARIIKAEAERKSK